MNSQEFSQQNKSKRFWYLNLIPGILFVFASVWIFAGWETAYDSLVIVISAALLISGVLEIISSVQYRNFLKGWGLSLFTGILDIFIGIKLILNSGISTGGLILLLGIVFLYHSAKIITWSIELKKYEARNWSSVLLGGILGVILSFIYLCNRTFTLQSLLFFTGFALLMIGTSEIYFSSVFRKLERQD